MLMETDDLVKVVIDLEARCGSWSLANSGYP